MPCVIQLSPASYSGWPGREPVEPPTGRVWQEISDSKSDGEVTITYSGGFDHGAVMVGRGQVIEQFGANVCQS